ncbi:MAG: aminoacyl-tRNA hydrolase [SAR86 cluster bacterium]|uniref:Peptidyl-tRNA hydrolase n=1 Tax=SAR86 cluster bacterium TaxID=2030880 RepID=A0A2A4MWU7_9GAMM|nr:MAG: aminoacyl-tRNA hydrolase [SAR86 cluster bacterium]
MQDSPLKLIVGLGNPGSQYQSNRHNAGVIFLDHLCQSYHGQLRNEAKFFGESASINVDGNEVRLLYPTTFMNNSGKAVAAVCKFYKLQPEQILVAYDEIDFEVGVTRLKVGGGHGGHNGLRDIINALGGSRDFKRLRIGVGHPGHRSLVANYVLGDPSKADAQSIMDDIHEAIAVMPKVINGDWEEAMRLLHS